MLVELTPGTARYKDNYKKVTYLLQYSSEYTSIHTRTQKKYFDLQTWTYIDAPPGIGGCKSMLIVFKFNTT